jgi:hypothetical protein
VERFAGKPAMVVVEHGKQLFPRGGFIRGDLRQILHKFALFLPRIARMSASLSA